MMLRSSAAGAAIVMALTAGAVLADYNCNAGIEFHDDGSFRRCVLNGNHRFTLGSGLTLVCANGYPIEDHPQGSLRRCTLAEPLAGKAPECVEGTRVELDERGVLLACQN